MCDVSARSRTPYGRNLRSPLRWRLSHVLALRRQIPDSIIIPVYISTALSIPRQPLRCCYVAPVVCPTHYVASLNQNYRFNFLFFSSEDFIPSIRKTGSKCWIESAPKRNKIECCPVLVPLKMVASTQLQALAIVSVTYSERDTTHDRVFSCLKPLLHVSQRDSCDL